MGTRLELQALLKAIPTVKDAYFQPPEGYKIQYPCIIYSRDETYKRHANNDPYVIEYRYLLTAIDKDPESPIFAALERFRKCTFDRAWAVGELNHQAFNLYF